ncbi:hypothetical protein DOTSEDRAFT_72428 [Dothistroma septosporum NZE10]|uniref:Cytochrome P450 n=1 Tax=Dothistroma septosporum (strain NZE10 / CBS 128990) TaxID=675120 RepID=M2YLY5_DOTSN|nr:hypothetical protein DOTSEDRAFT_72428 [Dothistroma septosporum NZE10]
MALLSLANNSSFLIAVVFGVFVVLTSLVLYLFQKPPFPKNAPQYYSETWPLLGAMHFFTQRWDYYRRGVASSKTGNFTFHAGPYPVVALSGEGSRKVFFEHKNLGFGEGYGALLGGSPDVKVDNNPLAESATGSAEFGQYFTRRLTALLKGPVLKNGLPQLLKDARTHFDDLANDHSGITNPFDSIYRMIFHFTMRTVACNDVANNPELLEQCLHHFETIEGTGTPLSIMYPWMPVPAKFKRLYAGAQLYRIFQNVVNERKRTGIKDDDALQFLIDHDDSITDILTFVLGSLFAGQLNSGINASFILCYLASNDYWMKRVRDEVNNVAEKYCPGTDLPLKDRLMRVPIEAWEGEFPNIDLCLKDTIRLQMSGAAFRKNTSNVDIPLGESGEVIPAGAYVTLGVGDMHYNPNVYPNPAEWDPARYERGEDKKETYGWVGWGVARHPCLGMRFAKLENNLIVAMFLAYFDDVQLLDGNKRPMAKVPKCNWNNHTARKPDVKIQLKYSLRQDGKA